MGTPNWPLHAAPQSDTAVPVALQKKSRKNYSPSLSQWIASHIKRRFKNRSLANESASQVLFLAKEIVAASFQISFVPGGDFMRKSLFTAFAFILTVGMAAAQTAG